MRKLTLFLLLIASVAQGARKLPAPEGCQEYRDIDQQNLDVLKGRMSFLGDKASGQVARLVTDAFGRSPMDLFTKMVSRSSISLIAAECTDISLRLRAGIFEAPGCLKTASRFVYDINPTSKAPHPYVGQLPPTFLEDDFAVLMQDPEVEDYLTELYDLVEAGELGNLWKFTIQHRHVKGDKKKAYKWLGVLFRDRPYHVGAYENCGLGELVAKTSNVVFTKLTETQVLPPPLKMHGESLYHFYTVGYVAQRLVREGADPLHAFSVTYVMNEMYEKAQALQTGKLNAKDVFLGFAGSAFAFTKETDAYVGYPQERFLQEYPKDPRATLRRGLVDTLVPNDT